ISTNNQITALLLTTFLTAITYTYNLSLHDALPISAEQRVTDGTADEGELEACVREPLTQGAENVLELIELVVQSGVRGLRIHRAPSSRFLLLTLRPGAGGSSGLHKPTGSR